MIAAMMVAAMVGGGGVAAAAPSEGQIRGAGAPSAIAGSYIVVFKEAAAGRSAARAQSLASTLSAKYDARVDHVYEHALNGFAGRLTEKAAKRLAAEPDVAYVEQNARVTAQATQPNPPSWGLDRIDQPALPLDSSYTYPTTASNVTAYVVDTGIRLTHTEFGGRAVFGTNTVGDGNNSDCNGHGTHVSGTIGGARYGVAKAVKLVAVKVLDCNGSGSFAGVVQGVDWVTGHHVSGPAVANMSIGGSPSTALENAVRNSIADGVVYVAAAGNSNANACNFTPARIAEAITVSSTDITDNRASSANYGPCVDLFAPGRNITSAWNTSDTAANVLSGTSMAAAHVTGAVALILGQAPGRTPAQVQSSIVSSASSGVVNPGTGSPNRILRVVPVKA